MSDDPFASEIAAKMAAEDAAYRLGVKLVAKVPNTLPSDISIERPDLTPPMPETREGLSFAS